MQFWWNVKKCEKFFKEISEKFHIMFPKMQKTLVKFLIKSFCKKFEQIRSDYKKVPEKNSKIFTQIFKKFQRILRKEWNFSKNLRKIRYLMKKMENNFGKNCKFFRDFWKNWSFCGNFYKILYFVGKFQEGLKLIFDEIISKF